LARLTEKKKTNMFISEDFLQILIILVPLLLIGIYPFRKCLWIYIGLVILVSGVIYSLTEIIQIRKIESKFTQLNSINVTNKRFPKNLGNVSYEFYVEFDEKFDRIYDKRTLILVEDFKPTQIFVIGYEHETQIWKKFRFFNETRIIEDEFYLIEKSFRKDGWESSFVFFKFHRHLPPKKQFIEIKKFIDYVKHNNLERVSIIINFSDYIFISLYHIISNIDKRSLFELEKELAEQRCFVPDINDFKYIHKVVK
jgi:DNA-binding transcriptional regulator/RsmH inhibitor MraZ